MSRVSQHVSCVNLPRTHRDYCTYVSDINECDIHPDICGPHSECTNHAGGYDCDCQDGYIMADSGCVG